MRQTQRDHEDLRNASAARRPKSKRDLPDPDEVYEDVSSSVAGEEDPGSADEELRKKPGKDI